MDEQSEMLEFSKEITKDDIRNLAMHNPVVYAVLAGLQKGWIDSWEQAMMRCVYLLHQESVSLRKQSLDLLNNRPGISPFNPLLR